MKNYNRDLLVLYKEVYNDDLLHHELESLHQLLLRIENNEIFCKAHQLITRNKITEKTKTILYAISNIHLKPFYFLINKN